MPDFDALWSAILTRLEGEKRRRRLRDVTRLPGGRIKLGDGRELLDFASNDYLGLSFHPELIKKSCEYTATQGTGAGASRLVAGNLAPFSEIEAKLAAGKGAEAALLFVSGVQANLTILPALLDAKTLGAEPLVYADRLNHASLIQGCIGAGVRQNRFRHNDLAHLEELLRRDEALGRPRFIITESVFSMDGDCADISALSAIAEKYGAFLYVDEAHATGVLGENGFGLVKGGRNILAMGTFSKGLGGFGAYVACSGVLREYLVNRCGGVIYATALPPAVLGAMQAAVDLLPSLDTERVYLQALAEDFRNRLRQAGLDTGASRTQIVPVILGDEAKVLEVAAGLEEDGFYVGAIRPPTVPAGTSRLRISLSASHESKNVAALADAIIRRAR
ncbi:MAG TPA: aminotransferase class I/II-fold pyridoxal phosphate-dependent enzyme [Acidocella sp.]|jgi:8-amino-7-oxononanoate synthase|nr:aminotransferase class I/II-fold pyridoxal phosphate-dependent enzyme [Acidocella sp.]